MNNTKYIMFGVYIMIDCKLIKDVYVININFVDYSKVLGFIIFLRYHNKDSKFKVNVNYNESIEDLNKIYSKIFYIFTELENVVITRNDTPYNRLFNPRNKASLIPIESTLKKGRKKKNE